MSHRHKTLSAALTSRPLRKASPWPYRPAGRARFRRTRLVLAACSLAVALAGFGCGEKRDPVWTSDAGPQATWCADIAPIVSNRCLRCHSATLSGADRNGAPVGVNFDTYEDASRLAQAMEERVVQGTMPPDGALPEAERSAFAAWVAAGTPEGVCP